MSLTIIQLLRVIHILGGAFWVGAILFMVFFLMPTLRSIGPASGQVMEQLTVVRKFPVYMSVVPMLTVLSGLALYGNLSRGTNGEWMRSGPGKTFGLGAVFAIIVAILGMAVNAPTGKKLGKLGAEIRARGGPATSDEQAEIQRLHARMDWAMKVAAVFVVLAAASMAIARYMPS